MKSVLTSSVMFTLVSASASYGSSPSGSTEQNAKTEEYLDSLNRSLCEYYLFAFIILTLLVLTLRFMQRLQRHVRHLTSLSATPGAQRYFFSLSPLQIWMKDHLTLAPILHHRRAAPIKFSNKVTLGVLPTRLQAGFIMLVVVYNLFACVWNVPWQSKELQVLPILRNRTGSLATVNLIPVIILSTIKNPLINVLELSYDCMNMMHRWLARLCILQGIAHTLCWLIAKVRTPQAGWPAVRTALQDVPFLYYGLVATVGFTALGLHSPKLFRHLAYEFFLHVHIALVAMTFGGLWIHLKAFPQLKYLLAAIVIWAATRVWRALTLLYRSVSFHSNCKAIVEILPADAMRVEIVLPRPWKAQPGQTIYLTIPAVGLWTAHPFSIAWSSINSTVFQTTSESGLSRNASTKTTFTNNVISEKRPVSLPVSRAVEAGIFDIEANKSATSISLIIKKHSGFTSRLYDRAAPLTKPLVLAAAVEGPYGMCPSMSSYGTILLFASGIGITHHLPMLRNLIAEAEQGTCATKMIRLVWVIPSTECLEWVRPWMHEILAMKGRREILRIDLHITRATMSTEIRSPSETVRMSRGRPDVRRVICEAAQEKLGCIGVSVCAGGGLADEVRRASRYVVRKGCNLDLHEEGFSW